MYKLIKAQGNYGDLTWYCGIEDEDYVGGQYIGVDNFIYE